MTIPKDYKATKQILDQIHDEVEATLAKYTLRYPQDDPPCNALVRQFCLQLQTCCEEFMINMWLTHCISAPVKEKD